MASVGQRGKWAEKQVKTWCTARNLADAGFDWYRYPDARAGSFQATPADFEAVQRGIPYLYEVKEVEHAYRLPEKNFSSDKRGRMQKRAWAGAECWVVICHMPEKVWRLVPLAVFLGPRVPSWDLSSYPTYESVDGPMTTIFGRLA